MADTSLIFNILANDKTGAGLNSASGRMAKFKSAINVAAVGIVGAAAVMGKKAVTIASDTAESTSKVQALLGSSSTAAIAFSDTSASAYGMAKREALGAVGAMAAVDRAMGTSKAEAAKLAVEYTKLSADLGSFNNASSAEVQEALTASLAGEYEMLKRYGIVVNDVTLSQEAARIGMVKQGATWDSAQKRQLSYNIIMRSTKAAQGDFARTSGGLANQTKIMSARMDDLQGKIGAKLLPAVVAVAGKFNEMLTWVEQNQTKAKILAGVVGGLAAAIVAAAVVMKLWAAATMVATAATNLWTLAKKAGTIAIYAQAAAIRIVWAATKVWTAGQWLLNAALMANPIGLIVIGIVALVAIVVLIATKTNWFQRIWAAAWGAIKGAVSGALNWIRSNWPLLLAILTGPVGLAVLFIVKNFDKIVGAAKALPGKIKSAVGNLLGLLKQHGLDFIQGFINGIIEKAKAIPGVIKDKVVGVAKSALHGFGLFGSPSRLTAKYGRWWSEGFAIGMQDKKADIVSRAKEMIEGLKAKLQEVKDFAAQIRDAFVSAGNPTSLIDSEDKTFGGLLAKMQAQAAAAKEFVAGIATLRQRGLNETTLSQIRDAGVGGGLSTVQALLGGSVSQVNAVASDINATGTAFGNSEAKAKFGIDPSRQKTVKITLDLTGADDDLLKRLRKQIRVQGGNVQVVLGRG